MNFEKLSDTVYICTSAEHSFGTDAFLLAHFSGYKTKDIVCDLGTGCGIIPLIMQKNRPPALTYAVDISEQAVDQLKLGIEKSSAENIIPVCADIKTLWENAPLGKCSLVTCNPPYYTAGTGMENVSKARNTARHEISCDINDVCRTASALLKFGGRLCLCNRPERLCGVIAAMKNNGLEPKKLRFVSKNPSCAPWLFLIEGKKGAKPFVQVMPQLYVWNENGYTDEMQSIYSLGTEE